MEIRKRIVKTFGRGVLLGSWQKRKGKAGSNGFVDLEENDKDDLGRQRQ